MRAFAILFVISIMIFSCQKKENLPERDKFGRRIFYDNLEYFKYTSSRKKIEPVLIIDTLCINQKAKALKDIQNNQLTYFTGSTPHEKELRAALKEHDIKLKTNSIYSSCIISEFKLRCYEGEMNDELIKRYGIKFFDSIWNSTLEAHVKNFPNEIFNEDGKILKLKDNYKFLLRTVHNSSL